MADKTQGSEVSTVEGAKRAAERQSSTPRALAFTQRGIETSNDFAATMSALMADVLDGSVTPQVANAVCNAGGKLLKVVELQIRYGNPRDVGKEGERTLQLVAGA